MKKQIDMGCICVEMEAAAMFAVAKFRGINLARILYPSDTVGDKGWGVFRPADEFRKVLFWHAAHIFKNF